MVCHVQSLCKNSPNSSADFFALKSFVLSINYSSTQLRENQSCFEHPPPDEKYHPSQKLTVSSIQSQSRILHPISSRCRQIFRPNLNPPPFIPNIPSHLSILDPIQTLKIQSQKTVQSYSIPSHSIQINPIQIIPVIILNPNPSSLFNLSAHPSIHHTHQKIKSNHPDTH